MTDDDERTLQVLEAVDDGEHDGTQELHDSRLVCVVRFPPNPFGFKYRVCLTDSGRAELDRLRQMKEVSDGE